MPQIFYVPMATCIISYVSYRKKVFQIKNCERNFFSIDTKKTFFWREQVFSAEAEVSLFVIGKNPHKLPSSS